MANKQFQGEVIESKDSSFTGRSGELVNLWEVAILVSDDVSRRFLIGPDALCRREAEQCVKGQHVRISAEAVPTIDGKVKWRALQIEKVQRDPLD